MQSFDVVIVGAGAAGLFCAGVAGQLGLKVLVLDHSEKVAEKIRISGGGRANFTNVDVTAANFLSENPRFAKSALSRFTRPISWLWSKNTALPSTKSTKASFSATARPKT